MHSLSKKVSCAVLASSMLLSVGSVYTEQNNLQNPLENKAEAASGWRYFTTVKSSTAGSDFALTSVAIAAAGALGYTASGMTGAAVTSVGSYHLGNALAKLKTVYMTDKQYINNYNQIEHVVTFYSDKARTKKLGTAKWITSLLYPGGDKTFAPNIQNVETAK